MELLYSSLLSFFLLIVIYLLHRYLLSYKNSKSGGNKKLPPGKTGFPVIGESRAFMSAGWKGHPEKFMFDRIAKYSSNVFKTSLAGSPMVVFCGADANKFIFSNESKLVQMTFTKSLYKIFPFLSQTTTNQEFMRLRKMILDILRLASLKGFIGTLDNIAHRHFVTNWEIRDTVVVSPLAYSYTISLAFCLFFSIEDPNHVAVFEKHVGFLIAGIFSLPIDMPGTPVNRAIKAYNFIRKEFLVIIKQRKIDLAEGNASPTQDILSRMLLKSDDNGKFMHEEVIADQIFGMIVGGQDTITSVCSSIIYYLAELPEVYQRVYREQLEIAKLKAPGESLNWDDIQKMKYSWNVACEAMRLQPPAPGGFREAITDLIYNGFSIPKGWKIYWSPISTHRNHEFFPEPQKFDPSRFEGSGPAPYTFIPFGGGRRMCPGNEYARLAILVFMHHLVKRFSWEKLIPDEKFIYNPMPKPEKGFPIRLFAHET